MKKARAVVVASDRKKQFQAIAKRIRLIGSRRSTPAVRALWEEAAAIIAKVGAQ